MVYTVKSASRSDFGCCISRYHQAKRQASLCDTLEDLSQLDVNIWGAKV